MTAQHPNVGLSLATSCSHGSSGTCFSELRLCHQTFLAGCLRPHHDLRRMSVIASGRRRRQVVGLYFWYLNFETLQPSPNSSQLL
ncbi:hypothetical protein CC86DRAFT_192996 [Ophiobolus disseminans]|uniref:Uncharacterized protein n=1 Tax=Ophiobolus disseminans TaxID=1469910 RepID=A0A6A7A534_9PLEO|nr:hypothetical protein CC86DRAFT_192996 [Ophiobolus disseminans]